MLEINMSNKVVVITGGASGMGQASANLFKQAGSVVYVLDLKKHPDNNITTLICDVSNPLDINTAITKILQHQQRIDHLFTNAGVLLSSKLIDSSQIDIDKTITINLKGTINAIQAVLPTMIENKSGSIVLMGSDQSLIGKSNNSIYGCTKAAVAQLAKSLSIEYAPHNIRVNCVCPGTIDTPFCRNAIKKYSKRTGIEEKIIYNELAQAQPIQRMGLPTEVANLVVFLCSDLASFMTGAIIPVDGGYTAQ